MNKKFSEMLQDSINKQNKRQLDNLKAIKEIKARIPQEENLKDNQINIMDLIK